MMNRRNAIKVLAAAALAGVLSPAMAQDYPARPVRMLVGFSAGGGVDAIARTLSTRLGEQMGQNFVVDNRPGATSTIAANVLVSSAPDGYTIALFSTSTAISASLFKQLPYDPVRDFLPVSMFSTFANVLAAGAAERFDARFTVVAADPLAARAKLEFPECGALLDGIDGGEQRRRVDTVARLPGGSGCCGHDFGHLPVSLICRGCGVSRAA